MAQTPAAIGSKSLIHRLFEYCCKYLVTLPPSLPNVLHTVHTYNKKKSNNQHLRMSGVYWGLMSMALMGRDLRKEMGAEDLANWVMRCQHEGGG